MTTVGTGIDITVLRIDRAYNSLGLLESVTSFADLAGKTTLNQVTRQYNGLGMLTQEFQEHNGAVNTATSLSVSYGYDATSASPAYDNELSLYTNGLRLAAVTYPNGRVLEFGYDSGEDDVWAASRTWPTPTAAPPRRCWRPTNTWGWAALCK